MGINLRAGCYDELFEGEGDNVSRSLLDHFGPGVPLGEPGVQFELNDEMGWSWRNLLKAFARERLGDNACPQIHATDAWNAVYLDAPIDRVVLWPDGKPATTGPLRSSRPPDDLTPIMDRMIDELGPRAGETTALQVGSLRDLLTELDALLESLGVQRTVDAVEALRQSYTDDRCDDDPEIQCLCHAWLTGVFALANRAPMWLIK